MKPFFSLYNLFILTNAFISPFFFIYQLLLRRKKNSSYIAYYFGYIMSALTTKMNVGVLFYVDFFKSFLFFFILPNFFLKKKYTATFG